MLAGINVASLVVKGVLAKMFFVLPYDKERLNLIVVWVRFTMDIGYCCEYCTLFCYAVRWDYRS